MGRDLVYLKTNGDGSVSVVFDEPGRPVNVLRGEVFDALSRVLDEVEALDPPPARVLFTSGKPGTFIAGADLKVVRDAPDGELDALLKQGQDVLNRVASLPMPTVAVLSGAALGGGLEVALACDARVAAAGEKPVFGLPEVTLGLVPGWGGTVRLVRRVGVEAAVAMLVSGRVVTPAQASAMGLVDAVVPADAMAAAARSVEPGKPREPEGWAALLERSRAELTALDPLMRPAGAAVLETVEAGLRDGEQAGLDAERRNLVAMRNTEQGRALIARFFDRRRPK